MPFRAFGLCSMPPARVKYFVTEEAFRRNIVVCSAAAANAIPVAEYTLSMTLLASLKNFWRFRAPGAGRALSGTARGMGRPRELIARSLAWSRWEQLAAPSPEIFQLQSEADRFDPFVPPDAAKKLG